MGNMRTLLLLASVLLVGTACATGPKESDAAKLIRYQAFAGEPVSTIPYYSSSSSMFDVVDDEHLLLTPRPSRAYLLKLSGPCLSYEQGSPSLLIDTNMSGQISVNFDRIRSLREPRLTCSITEIRPIDIKALRAAEKAVVNS